MLTYIASGKTGNGKGSFVGLICALCIVSGMVLPMISGPINRNGLINPLWSCVYGMGFFLVDTLHLQGSGIQVARWLFGLLLWPIAVSIAVVASLRSLAASKHKRIILAVYALSFMLVFDIPRVASGPLKMLPLFTRFIDY